ncbi:MAG: Uma2 family endonuclease [Hyphomicrobium sp.]
MNAPFLKHMTADEFVAWAARQDLGRFELIDGLVVEMNAERSIHARVKRRAANALDAALLRSGLVGEVFGDGMAVRISDRIVHEPDALVRLGPPLDDDATVVTDPVVVVEVLSPSTGPVDTNAKLINYFSLPSVEHYLVVNTSKRLIQYFRRDASGSTIMTIVSEGELYLDPPGLKMKIEEVFSA